MADRYLEELLDLAVDAARRAGSMALERFRDATSFNVHTKDDGLNNVVTEVDTEAEDLLRSLLTRNNDTIFLGEESGGDRSFERLTWVVDPIDGTVNFAKGLPIWCVSIAAVRKGEPVVGVIYNPNLDETFTATKEGGACLNGRPLKVSETEDVDASLLVTGFPYNVHENPYGTIEAFAEVLRRGIAVRRLGSAALDLAYVAAGRFDGFWEVALNPWDVAAGALLVNEAGGTISSYAPGGSQYADAPTRDLVVDRIAATNGRIHEGLVQLLREAESRTTQSAISR